MDNCCLVPLQNQEASSDLLGGEKDADENGHWPDPLYTERDPVGPLVGSVDGALVHSCREELAYLRVSKCPGP